VQDFCRGHFSGRVRPPDRLRLSALAGEGVSAIAAIIGYLVGCSAIGTAAWPAASHTLNGR